MEDILDVSTEKLARLKEEALQIEDDTLMRYIRIFSELGGQIRYASQKRVQVEVAFIKLCRPAMETNTDVLLDRIRVLEEEFEEKMAQLQSGAISYGGGWQNGEAPRDAAAEPKKPAPEAPAPKSLPEDVQNVVKNWHNVLNRLHPLLRTYLKGAQLKAVGDGKLGIIAATPTGEAFLKETRHLQEIKHVILQDTGKDMEILVACMENDPHSEVGAIDIEQVIHTEIEFEDE